MEKIIELKPIRESTSDYEILEERLKRFLKERIYYPLLRELALPKNKINNAASKSSLINALFNGQITFHLGTFSGKFNAQTSKELKELGAIFHKKEGTFKLNYSQLPIEVKNVISSSEARFVEKLQKLDRHLASIVPEEMASQFQSADLFDRTLFKVNREFQKNVKNITLAPELTESQRAKIASEWSNNMELWIRNFTKDQIQELRSKVLESTLAGNRYGSLIQTIQDSYGVSADKAKFLARQETSLLMAKFKETRYTEAGVHEYIWMCVHRPHDPTPNHHIPGNVRYSHGLLEGKIFRWDNPPITTNPGQTVRRNNPGQDYNCRCYPRPILRVKT